MEEKIDLRIRKTYLALHNAFLSILEEKRFDDLTVNELCERAMIRRTTFYKHFADKYEYFSFYIKEVVATFQDRLDPDVAEGEVHAYLLHMCRELICFLQRHNRFVQNIRDSNAFPLLLSILLDQISEDVKQVLYRANAEKNVDKKQIQGISAFYAGGLLNTFFQYSKHDILIDEEQLISIVSMFNEKM